MNKSTLTDADNRMVVYRGQEAGGREEKEDLTLDGEHAMQYTDDVLQNRILESNIMLLTDDTTIELIKFKSDTD